MKRIPLTRGKFALVDDEDYKKFSKFKWFARKSVTNHGINWYAHRQFRHKTLKNKKGQSKQICLLLHREIMCVSKGKCVDHRNGNGLDCQKENLRLATHQQNLWNQNWLSTPDKPYKGVSKYKVESRQGWTASISCGGHAIYLGWFKSAKRAAKTYDKLAKILFGEFARLNFPEDK